MSKISGGARRAPSAKAEAGPPDKITPCGANFLIRANGAFHGKISQYTPDSRTARAISRVYCAPKSRIKMRELAGAAVLSGADMNKNKMSRPLGAGENPFARAHSPR